MKTNNYQNKTTMDKLLTALKKIAEMSDSGSAENTVINMKRIASDAISESPTPASENIYFVACDENDPDYCGDYISSDGTGLARLKEVRLPSSVQDGEVDILQYDLSSQSDENKYKIIRTIGMVAAENLMRCYYAMKLKSHIEFMVVNDGDGEKFILFFSKSSPQLLKELASLHFKEKDIQEFSATQVKTID